MALDLGLHLGLGSGGGFSPASLFAAGEKGAWYDPSDLTTMFQSGTRASPGAAVTADGDPVGLILDKSGNQNDFTQSTAAARPLYKTDGTLHWLLFDGVDDGLTTAAGRTWAATSDFFMALYNAANDLVYVAAANGTAGSDYLGVAQDNNVGANNANVGTPTTLVNGAALATNDRDGVYEAIGSTAAKVLEVDDAAIAFGTLIVGNYGGFELSSRVYGIIIKPASASNRASTRTWLGAKAGIVL